LAYLYVALARAVGLRAYFAWVDELWDESKDPHSCAIIFTSGGALLCDPANWVGVPHVKFRVLSDLEVAALHLSCGADLKTCEVACKLLPENVIPHANLFEHYRSQGRWDDAAAQAAQMESLDRDGVFTCYARSVLLMREGNTELAVDLLQKAISSAPRRDILYLELGNACRKQNRLAEAHKAYEFALRCPTGAETRSYVLALLAAVEAQICIEKNDLAGALACAERAARTSVDEEFSELVESVMRMIGDNTHPSSKYPK
jgi:tetratricopeptide (TPR) repeat protein